MPIVADSHYSPPSWLPGGQLQTLFPALVRRAVWVTRQKERLELDDGDFLDLQWSGRDSARLAILSHGLEGHAQAAYIQTMAAALVRRGWDVLAWNCRGCSDSPNRLLSFYHSGLTEDLDAVVQHALASHPAERIDLVGFSLGGNLTLKYLGEREPPPRLHRAVAFSVPCDLEDAATHLAEPVNRLYMRRFLRTLREKIRAKEQRFPGRLDLTRLETVRNFHQFDNLYTAPLHGFADAHDYWTRSSSRQFLSRITLPTLLVNAANDPFLGDRCYPREEAQQSSRFHLEVPAQGGHVGFPGLDGDGEYWSEKRAVSFLEEP